MNKRKKYRTDFLFVRPNFIMGVGSVMNISGNYYRINYSKSGAVADKKAIESDWAIIGQDIKQAIHENILELAEQNE